MADREYKNDELQNDEMIKFEVQHKAMRSFRVEAILRLYVAMGFLISALALIYFGFSFLNIELRPDQQMALAFAGAGLAIALLSTAYLVIRRQQITLRSEAYEIQTHDRDVVREWARFEMLGRKLLEIRGISFNSRSPRAIVAALAVNKVIVPEEANDIQRALDVRNKVVHEVDPLPSLVVGLAASVLSKANQKLEDEISGSRISSKARPIVLED